MNETISSFGNKTFTEIVNDTVVINPAITMVMANTSLLKNIHDYLITTLLVSVMFAMGCSITWAEVLEHLRKPVGIFAGFVSQFIFLPFSAYLLVTMFEIQPLHAAGLLILASSPGGVTSNLFTFFCDGNVSLSVTMTAMSTILALFMMPFNIWLYSNSLQSENIVIPYAKMSISLFWLSVPVLGGMFMYWKYPKIAPILTKIGSFSGFAIIIVCEALEVMIFPDIFDNVPTKIFAAEFLLPIMGIVLGFAFASIFKLPYSYRRTIAIEAGVQNVGTALAIVSLSYPFEQLKQVWLFPFMYAFSMFIVCCLLALWVQVHKRICGGSFNLESDPSKLVKIQDYQARSTTSLKSDIEYTPMENMEEEEPRTKSLNIEPIG